MPVTEHNEDTQDQLGYDESKNYALSGKIMLASIIILFVVVVFLVVLHLYARWYLMRLQRRNEIRRRNRRNRSSRLVFYVDNNRAPASPTGELDPTILKSLPLFIYSSKPDGSTPECAVCLSEFEEGEMVRVLPKCKHSFHTECIDMWFHSNSTCPLCRSSVEPVIEHETKILIEQETGSSSLNIETTSLGDRRKGIDVRINVADRAELQVETQFQLASPSDGLRSPGSLLLSRLLNMGKKSPVVSPSASVGPSCLPVTSESSIELTR